MEDIAARPALALSMLSGMVAGILALITGLVAIIRKEKAILVYIACIIGALLLMFLAGEFTSPH
jgi:thiamine transporter ThiT